MELSHKVTVLLRLKTNSEAEFLYFKLKFANFSYLKVARQKAICHDVEKYCLVDPKGTSP